MHSGLPSADPTVKRCSPQRATTRPSPDASAPTAARRNGLDEPGPCSGPFHAAQAHAAEAPQVKGRTRSRSAGRRRRGLFCQRPCETVDRPGGRAPRLPWLAEWSMGPACQSLAKIWSCCKLRRKLCQRRGGQRADRRRQSPSRGCVRSTHRAASAPPMRTPFAFNHQCAQWRILVLHRLAGYVCGCAWRPWPSRRRVRGVAGARVAICVCARCWAARGGGSAPRGEDGRRCAAREPHKNVASVGSHTYVPVRGLPRSTGIPYSTVQYLYGHRLDPRAPRARSHRLTYVRPSTLQQVRLDTWFEVGKQVT